MLQVLARCEHSLHELVGVCGTVELELLELGPTRRFNKRSERGAIRSIHNKQIQRGQVCKFSTEELEQAADTTVQRWRDVIEVKGLDIDRLDLLREYDAHNGEVEREVGVLHALLVIVAEYGPLVEADGVHARPDNVRECAPLVADLFDHAQVLEAELVEDLDEDVVGQAVDRKRLARL